MVGYKLSKNDWVTPFFVIFRSVREILLVTVFLEHPVLMGLEHEPIKGVGRVRRSPIDINYSMGRTFTLIPWTLR